MKLRLKVVIDIIWFLLILSMIIANAYNHSWVTLFWLLILLIHCLYLIKDYSNVTIEVNNNIYNITKRVSDGKE